MNNTTESKVLLSINYLARANSDLARDYLTEDQVNFWIDNYSLTQFCNGTVRRVIFTQITPNRYEVRTEKV